jgi:MFS family permease
VKSDASFFKQLKFKVNWFLSLGFFCGQIIEFIVTDWATLFGKEVLGMGASVATLCYMLYLIGVIIGRFSIGWALNHQSEQFWIKFGGVVGGAGFIGMLVLSVVLVEINQPIAYFLALFGFFLSGLGSAAMAPIFFSIAGRVLEGNNLMAVAQLTFINTILIFLAKTVLAWVAEVTSITVSLSISGLVMCALFYFGKIGSKVRI